MSAPRLLDATELNARRKSRMLDAPVFFPKHNAIEIAELATAHLRAMERGVDSQALRRALVKAARDLVALTVHVEGGAHE